MVLSCLALQTLWYISPVYCTPCTLPSRSSHIFSVVWKDPANRQDMAEGKTTNELGFTAKRGSSPSFISMLYLFYTCSSMFWGFFSYWMLSLPQLQLPCSRSLSDGHITQSVLPSWYWIVATSKTVLFHKLHTHYLLAVSVRRELRLQGCGREKKWQHNRN